MMRCWILAGSFALAVLAGEARASDPDAALAEKDSASVNNLAAVERLAVEQKWILVAREPNSRL
jgi:hypothetical protein